MGRRGNSLLGAGDNGSTHLNGDTAGSGLETHPFDRLPGGADEFDAGIAARFCEGGVFAQKTVAGMDGFGIGSTSGFDNPGGDEIAFRRGAGADAHGLIRHLDVEGGAVGFGKDSDAGDSHLAKGADDADRNLAAIGDKHFSEQLGV